jgi:hypothetical protein
LKKVSKHVKTGQPIPDDLLQKKIASQNQNVATMTLNQIFLASVDLILNSAYDKDMIKKQKLIQEENDKKIAEAKKHGQSLVQFMRNTETIGMFRNNIKMDKDQNIDTSDLWHTLARKIESTNH